MSLTTTLSITISPRAGGSQTITLTNLTQVLASIDSIYVTLLDLVGVDQSLHTSPDVLSIKMQSPLNIELISIKDIVEAIKEILNLPRAIQQEKIKTESLKKQLEEDTLQVRITQEELTIQQQESESMTIQKRIEVDILSEQYKRQRIQTALTAHEAVTKIIENLDYVRSKSPEVAMNLAPYSRQIVAEIANLVNSDLEIEVTISETTAILPKKSFPDLD